MRFLGLIFIVWCNAVLAQSAADFDKHFKALADDGKFSGTIRIEKSGAILFEKSYGKASVELDVNNTNATVYRLGSLTQPFMAMALLNAVQKDQINLDNPVTSYITGFEPTGVSGTADNSGKEGKSGTIAAITLRHLLDHTSGLPDFILNPDYFADHTCGGFNQMDFMEKYVNVPLDFVPGTSSALSHTNYYVLGLVLERLYGKPLAEIFNELLLQPAGVKSAGIDDGKVIIKGLANGYTLAESEDKLERTYQVNMDFIGGAGAMYANAADLSKLLKGYSFNIERKKSDDPMDMLKAMDYTYTDGWFLNNIAGTDALSSTGQLMGFVSSVDVYPAPELTVIVLSNHDHASIAKIRYDAAAMTLGAPYVPNEVFTAGKLKGDKLTDYVGDYTIAMFGKPMNVKVKQEGEGLMVGNANDSGMVPLSLIKDDFFFVQDDPGTIVHFVRNADKSIAALELIAGNSLLKAPKQKTE